LSAPVRTKRVKLKMCRSDADATPEGRHDRAESPPMDSRPAARPGGVARGL
jgi:hypothetical protein